MKKKRIQRALILLLALTMIWGSGFVGNDLGEVKAAGTKTLTSSVDFETLKSIAEKYIGCPYIWGAEGPNAFDCSGYVDYVFREAGIIDFLAVAGHSTVAHINYVTSHGIANSGFIPSSSSSEAYLIANAGLIPGDLFYLCTGASAGESYHVGIYMGNGQVLECTGLGEENTAANPGIGVKYSTFSGFTGSEKGNWKQTFIIHTITPTGTMDIHKSTANATISDNNSCYSLAGAVYGVYADANCGSLISSITTNAAGTTGEVTLKPGTYYVKEISPAKGYAIDDTVYTVTVQSGEKTTLPVSDMPQNAMVEIVLEKIDKELNAGIPQGSATLEGTEFVVKFHPGYYDNSNIDSAPIARTWTLTTIQEEGKYVACLDDSCKIAGDDYYYTSSGAITLPLGTISIQETKAPIGYLLDEQIYVEQITSEGTAENVTTYQVVTVMEQVKRGDLELVKVEDGSLKRMANVTFEMISKTTGESHRFMTDENGMYRTSSKWNSHTANTNAAKSSSDGIWFGSGEPDDSKGALIYDTYEIKEIAGEANAGYKLLSFEITISRDQTTIDLGTITNDKEDTPTVDETPKEPETPKEEKKTEEPQKAVTKRASAKTGDSMNLIIWMALSILAAGSGIVIVYCKKYQS